MLPYSPVLGIISMILTLPLGTGSAPADDNGWVGQRAMVKHSGVKVVYTEPNGSRVETKIKGIVQTVRSEKDGWLEVGNNGEPGWVDKDEMESFSLAVNKAVYDSGRLTSSSSSLNCAASQLL
jgi:hypothetical protein